MELKYTVVKIEIPDDLPVVIIDNKKVIKVSDDLFCAEKAIAIRDEFYKKDINNDFIFEVVVDYVEQRFQTL